MRKVIVSILTIAFLSSVAVNADVGQAFSYKSKGLSAWAFCYVPPTEPCGEATYVSLFAGEAVEKTGPGKPTQVAAAAVDVYQFNSCTYETLGYLFGYAELTPDQFDADKNLDVTSLTATIPATDYLTWESVSLDVEVTWLGLGPAYRSKGNNMFWHPGGKFASKYDATYRDASADMSLATRGGTLQCTADYAQLLNARSAYMEFMKK